MGTTAPGMLMGSRKKNEITDPSVFIFTVEVTEADRTMSVPFEIFGAYSRDFGDVTVDWGDNLQTALLTASKHAVTSSNRVHQYAKAGTYTVTIHCSENKIPLFSWNKYGVSKDASKVRSISEKMRKLFAGFVVNGKA